MPCSRTVGPGSTPQSICKVEDLRRTQWRKLHSARGKQNEQLVVREPRWCLGTQPAPVLKGIGRFCDPLIQASVVALVKGPLQQTVFRNGDE